MSVIESLRAEYHQRLINSNVLSSSVAGNVPSNADGSNTSSIALAKSIIKHILIHLTEAGHLIDNPVPKAKLPGQEAGKLFEQHTKTFIEASLHELNHLRPGKYQFVMGKAINEFSQYEHLKDLSEALKNNRSLKAALGDYIICPDITIGRIPVSDQEINQNRTVISNQNVAGLTPVRATNSTRMILHSSISCKWTLRSDRAQNARTEGLNLIRNRKGQTPHIVVVTGEPTPSRISSLALGTGDIDCVYHFALRELTQSVNELGNDIASELLETLVSGKRLRDISDLPFDLIT